MRGTLQNLEYEVEWRSRPGSMSTEKGRKEAVANLEVRRREIELLAKELIQLPNSIEVARKLATMLLDALYAVGAAQQSCEINAADLAYRNEK